MKMSKRSSVAVGLVAVVVILLALPAGLIAVGNYNAKKISDQLVETFDNYDRNMAIQELSELRGMILEIESLSHEDISQSILLDELEGIATHHQHFTNQYLKDFTFLILSTSNVEDLCEEFILQIDHQIHSIEYGAEGE